MLVSVGAWMASPFLRLSAEVTTFPGIGAGPWPVGTGWWGAEPQKVARLQVVGQAQDERHPRAWLLLWVGGGAGRWQVEARCS